jgi:hypothetical protein
VEELTFNKYHQKSVPIKSRGGFWLMFKIYLLSWKNSLQYIQSGPHANKIDHGPFINGQVPSLFVEELSFNKYHQDSLSVKWAIPFRKRSIPSLLVEKLSFNKCHQDSLPIKSK